MFRQRWHVHGEYHTIIISDDGIVYSFGRNDGALGHYKNVSVPTPIPNLPKINMISCGGNFTVCVDHEGFIWSFGANRSGQLGTGNTTYFNVPQKTSFSIISAGCWSFSLFQSDKGEIFSCGHNLHGQCGLVHFDTQITPSLILNVPPNIVHFVCGSSQNLFLDSEGNVFSVGFNNKGQLGLGHNRN